MTVSFRMKIEGMGHNVDAFEAGTKEALRQALAGIAQAGHAEWIRLAQARLRSSRDEYVGGLMKKDSFKVAKDGSSEPVFTISLIGEMANNFEFGMSSFDMKNVRPGWLGGKRAKIGKDGKRYITIPFRHSTGSSPRLAYTGKAAMANLKTELFKTVKAYGLDRMVRAASGQVMEGAVGKVPGRADVHQYLKGLTKIQKANKGGKSGSSTLITWRRMSESSAEDSWVHPGLDAANILPEVERYIDEEMGRVVEKILGAA